MNIILHADDFGYDEDTTKATIELLNKGCLSSASIMPNMPCTKMALEYARTHSDKSFGVHLTYVDHLNPCSIPEDIPSLVNKDGVFRMSDEILKDALTLKLETKDIIKESLAQIQVLKNNGVNISHLDSHGHLHKYPSFQIALGTICKLSGIYRVRRVQNVFIAPQKFGPKSLLRWFLNKGVVSRFKSTDYFYMSASNLDTNWSDEILSRLDNLPKSSIIEVGVHPGIKSDGVEAYRVPEYHEIQLFSELIKKQGKHTIINWNDV